MDGPTRFIQVTNDNHLVKYASNSSWVGVPKADLTFPFPYGNMGAPVSSFLQQFNGGLNSSISFPFEGLEITVMTSCYVLVNISELHAVSCRVDNEPLATNIPQFSQNNWPICNSGNLADGEHTLTIDISSSAILFDYILFAPSPTKMLNLTDVSTRIEASDPSVTYSTQFVIQNNTGLTRFINDSEASVTIPFFGQQLTWYGAFLFPLQAGSSPVQYSIDSGTPSEFVLGADIPFNFSALLNQPLFQTEVLPQGHHQVTATYLGNGGIPLGLSFIVVQNVSNIAPSPLPNSTMADVPTTTPRKITSAGSRNDLDMKIGIAVGVGIFLLIIILFLFRRWKKCGLKERKSEERFDISSNRERAMRTVSTVMPNSFHVHDSGQSRNRLLTQHRRPAFATETSNGSTEALFNSYIITPFRIPSLPVADFGGEDKILTDNNPRPLPLAVRDSHFPNSDAADLSLDQHNRPLPNIFVQTSHLADLGPTRAAAEALETSASAALFSRLSFTARPEERHVDSGVRLNREALFYNETNSEWSLRSKDRLPPLYTYD